MRDMSDVKFVNGGLMAGRVFITWRGVAAIEENGNRINIIVSGGKEYVCGPFLNACAVFDVIVKEMGDNR